MRKLQRYLLSALVSAGLAMGSAMPVAAQHRSEQRGQVERRAQPQHGQVEHRGRNENYYNGMQDSVRKGNYARNDKRRHNNGGIGPGTGAAIGGVGGAILGAVFGGGLKSTLIGGAAGAGIGAIVGEATKGNDHNKDRRHGHR